MKVVDTGYICGVVKMGAESLTFMLRIGTVSAPMTV